MFKLKIRVYFLPKTGSNIPKVLTHKTLVKATGCNKLLICILPWHTNTKTGNSL